MTDAPDDAPVSTGAVAPVESRHWPSREVYTAPIPTPSEDPAMYGNQPDEGGSIPELSSDERKRLRRDLAGVAARTRELLPGEFVVGAEVSDGVDGPRAMVAVQPPVGPLVSANYVPEDAELRIDDEERDDIATGLAASAALQVKRALPDDRPATAQ